MKNFSVKDFLEYCRSRGDDTYNPINSFGCAVTQFMHSHDPRVTNSILRAGPSDGDLEYAEGYDRTDRERTPLVRLTGMSRQHTQALFGITKFSDLADRYEAMEKINEKRFHDLGSRAGGQDRPNL